LYFFLKAIFCDFFKLPLQINSRKIKYTNVEQVLTPIVEFAQGLYPKLTEKPIVVDCGCNIGMIGLLYYLNDKSTKYIGYEPSTELHSIASGNVVGFGVVIKKAISNKTGNAIFYEELDDIKTGSHINPNYLNVNKYLKYKVKTISLGQALKYKKINLLKIDIEGEEFNINFQHFLKNKKIVNFYLEIHPNLNKKIGKKIEELEKIMKISLRADFHPKLRGEDFYNIVVYGQGLDIN
jgi:FkbM family methyltransferase